MGCLERLTFSEIALERSLAREYLACPRDVLLLKSLLFYVVVPAPASLAAAVFIVASVAVLLLFGLLPDARGRGGGIQLPLDLQNRACFVAAS